MPPIGRPELATRRVLAEPLLAAIPRKHPLASAATLSIKDFDGQPFVMYSPYESRYFHDLLVALFTQADILPRYVQHLGQIHSILAMVRAGLGAAIVPAAAASLRIADVKLRPLKLRSPTPVELFLVWRRDCENPLLPSLIEIASELTSSTPDQ
jgi:DNA-binding transcriptional LysR family regulator